MFQVTGFTFQGKAGGARFAYTGGMKYALLLLLFAPAVLAHPLDDRAQMASEVVIISDQRLEYVLHFRYLDATASFTEITGRLDADDDGFVTPAELKRRLNALVDDLVFPVTIRVDGERISLTPEFDRFVFQDLNRPGIDPKAGVPTDNLRIHYRFVFSWDAPQPLAPRDHTVEYSFNGGMAVISDITEQMVAFDARENARHRINEVRHSSVGIPTMSFVWNVPPTATEPLPNEPEPQPAPHGTVTVTEEPPAAPNIPAWLTLFAGVGLAMAGGAALARRRRIGTGLLMVIGGVAVALVAAARLGWF
jgi:hypothetical protein